MEVNALGEEMAYQYCGCGSRHCSGSISIEPDHDDNMNRNFQVSVMSESGTTQAIVWLSPDGLRSLIDQAEAILSICVNKDGDL